MDKNVKNALVIIAALLIGLAIFRLGQYYFLKHQVENAVSGLIESTDQSMKETQARLAASQREREQQTKKRQAELEHQKSIKEQQEFEANLLCAANEDTGKCSCYNKKTSLRVSMTSEQCQAYVDQQFKQ